MQPTKTHLPGEFMKRFIIEQSEVELDTTHTGLAFAFIGDLS